MIKVKPIIYAGGPLVFSEYANAGSPITGNGNIPGGILFKRAVTWWKLRIFVSAVSGTSPSLTFNVYIDNFGSPYVTLPPITSPIYYEVTQTSDNRLVLAIYNTNQEILQQVYLGTFWGAMGMNLSWTVSGSSPSFSVSAYLVYEDGGEE